MEHDAFGVQHAKVPAHETRMLEIQFGDLAFTFHRAEVGAPRYGTGRDVFVASDLDRFYFVPGLLNPNDVVKMSGVMAYPFAH